MNYRYPRDQAKHESITFEIRNRRKKIAQHYRIIGKLHERLLRIGTLNEQFQKKMNLRSIVQAINPDVK